MGDQRLPLSIEVEHHVVLHPADVDNLRQCHLAVFPIDLEENRRRDIVHAFPRGIILLRFIHSHEELIVADGLQQEVEGTHLVALEGILFEGGGEDDLCLLGQHVSQLHPVEVGHLDIQEEQVGLLLLDGIDGFYRVGKRAQQLQFGCLGYERLQQFHRQRLVIDDHTTQAHL